VRINLDNLELRLGRAVPSLYRSFVAGRSLEDLEPTAASPAELVALNLECRADGVDGPTRFGFVLYSSELIKKRCTKNGI